jgi:hypothetical protein
LPSKQRKNPQGEHHVDIQSKKVYLNKIKSPKANTYLPWGERII